MLFVLFYVRDECYAIAGKKVVEVVPCVKMRKLPKTPAYVAGLLNYRGVGVPVLDLCALFSGDGCSSLMSSRILLVTLRDEKGVEHTLGLLAENVTDTVDCDPDEFSATGITNPETPFLGDIATIKERIVQRIEIDALLPKPVRETLFR